MDTGPARTSKDTFVDRHELRSIEHMASGTVPPTDFDASQERPHFSAESIDDLERFAGSLF